ncbi:MAG: lipocalin family protein [Pseudomonadales bacterium]|nr:lipocalin family protein [Pseudomonadales bacterium]
MLLGLWGLSFPAFSVQEVTTVAHVDLNRYLGRWYEIASFPMFFQRHCLRNTQAEYSLNEHGEILVYNHCETANELETAHGHAHVVPGSHGARLRVSFFWPFYGNYWIIGLDEQYRWAVVGEPGRDYLWILARTPQLTSTELHKALLSAQAQGFDLSKLHYTSQDPAH